MIASTLRDHRSSYLGGYGEHLTASERVSAIDPARDLPKSSAFFHAYLHFTNEGSAAAGDIVFRRLCRSLVQHFGMATC